MTDAPVTPVSFAAMHPVTRLGRVIQQLGSFGDLHAHELDGLAAELEAAGAADLAARLRLFRDMQRDEAQLVLDELADIRTDLATAAAAGSGEARRETDASATTASGAYDPAVNSPKRAKWLAEQAAEGERLRAPRSRRDLLGRTTPDSDA